MRKIISTGIIVACMVLRAHAHDWYPHECCHNRDCAPADSIEQVPTGKLAAAGMIFGPGSNLPSMLVIKTKHGTVVVPEGFARKASPDGQWHACIRDNGVAPPTLICLFEPPSM